MLNLNQLFLQFHDEISLTEIYKEKIKTGRDALRTKIGNKFTENGRSKPKHCMQGSYATKIAIMPLEDDEFDLDNGVYLQGYASNNQNEWPGTSTVHTWIKDAVTGHTNTPPVDKNTCVRVIYQDKYHIDLPIYIMGEDENNNEIAYLAHKSKGWIVSDPKSFTAWFQSYVSSEGQQIRRLVKYLKAWKNYKDINIKGMAIAILVCNHYNIVSERDDTALLNTVVNIIDELEDNFHCYKPTAPTDEDLFEGVSETRKNSILNGLNSLKNSLDKAINEKSNEKEGTDILRDVFGERFPNGEDKTQNTYIKTLAPINLKGEDGHFA